MTFHAHLIPDFLDFAIRSNQKSAAHDSLENPAHELLRAPHAIFFDHLVRGITQQRKIEFLLLLEVGQSLFRVRARAQNNHVLLVEVFLCVAKLGRFGRSTWCVGFREEK